MKKISFCTILVLFFSFILSSQQKDQVILTIDNHNITKAEFLRIYSKNNAKNNPDSKSVREYMEMFINYKLKVIEAEHQGFDTVSSFVSEFKNYRDQLSKPYLEDKTTTDNLMHEAYERMKSEVRCRHIFIKLNIYPAPEDTLKAYKKAMEAREKLLKGEPWDSVMVKYTEDKNYLRNNDIGYFTAFQTVYLYEEAAFALKKGEISIPVRTNRGYYIIQLIDRRPSRGEIKVAHIMVAFPENAKPDEIDSAHKKIENIYLRLNSGEKFEDLAKKYSDDKRSADKGGELNWFGVGQMIPEFENAAFSLFKDGDYSVPIRSSFGWHIIKRIASRPLASFEERKDFIKQHIQTDERIQRGKLAVIEKVKKKYNFKDHPEKLKALKSILDTSIFKGTWDKAKADALKNEILFTLGNNSYSVKDLADYIVTNNRIHKIISIDVLVDMMYKDYVNAKIVEYENNHLEEEYPEFRYLVQEYHDGILLFNLMEQKIWTQAAKDTVGLEKYYNDHIDVYKWGKRVDALVVTSPNKSLIDEAYKLAPDFNSGIIKGKDILFKVCKDSVKACINVTESLFEKGDNLFLDSIGWEPGISEIILKEGKYGFFVKKGTKEPGQKTLQDAKGTCIADYQLYLEQQYISELRKKYKITVNDDVLNSLGSK